MPPEFEGSSEMHGSQCSPVWETGTMIRGQDRGNKKKSLSQCSPVWETGTIKVGCLIVAPDGQVSM